MPLYEYQCPNHGVIENYQSLNEGNLIFCPRCMAEGKGSVPVTKLISSGIFKMGGQIPFISKSMQELALGEVEKLKKRRKKK